MKRIDYIVSMILIALAAVIYNVTMFYVVHSYTIFDIVGNLIFLVPFIIFAYVAWTYKVPQVIENTELSQAYEPWQLVGQVESNLRQIKDLVRNSYFEESVRLAALELIDKVATESLELAKQANQQLLEKK
jgi:glycopeptide antibiotics resistance protein